MARRQRQSRAEPEHDEQVKLMLRVEDQMEQDPQLALLFAIPNGGHRGKRQAGMLKAEGVKAGVPDLFLAVPMAPYHGLFIELKYGKNTLRGNQPHWVRMLSSMGYRVEVCWGWKAAWDVICDYCAIIDAPAHITREQLWEAAEEGA